VNKKTGIGIAIGTIIVTVFVILITVNIDLAENNYQNSTTNEEPITALINYRAIGEIRQEDGVAIIDINPKSNTFGEILQDVPIGKEVLMHHPFYNHDSSKLYNTALAGERLYRINIHENTIFDVTPIETGSCIVGEDMYFSKEMDKFYLTCMGSDKIIIFDENTDQVIGEISSDKEQNPGAFVKHPHGISADEEIDRMIVTETVSPALDDPGTTVTIIEYSTGKILSNIELLQDENTPSAPVEVQFHPKKHIAYISGMLDGTIWALVWNKQTESFDSNLVDDGKTRDQNMPLDITFGPSENLYVSFANPGVVNEYSLENPEQPKLLRTLPAQQGAHHVLFSPNNQYMFVQNNLLNLDGINAGTISVVDFETGNLITTLDEFTEQGMMIESLDLLMNNSINQKVTVLEN
jgi:DNA-binding beta-propeller fold protein YncE